MWITSKIFKNHFLNIYQEMTIVYYRKGSDIRRYLQNLGEEEEEAINKIIIFELIKRIDIVKRIMKLSDHWFTALSEENGQIVYVSGRKDLEEFRLKGALKIRVEIKWTYDADTTGMPKDKDGELIAKVEDGLRSVMEKDKLAILTGNYLGAGSKYWVYYTRHLASFGERLNDYLQSYDLLPLELHCEEDPEWEEYLDLLTLED